MRRSLWAILGMIGVGTSASAQVPPTSIPGSADPARAAQRLQIDSELNREPLPSDIDIQQEDAKGNRYKIDKEKGSGTMKLRQQGTNNNAVMKQGGGTGNRIDIQQSGQGNSSQVESTGSGNTVIIRQSGGE